MRETKKIYAQRFKAAVTSGEPVVNKLGDEYIFRDDVEFRCAYSRKDRARRMLPKFWFVSNEGDVISVYKDKPLWLMKDRDNGRYSYHFNLIGKDTVNNKNIELHNLIGLVFESYRFGQAKELLDEHGIYAFGVLDNKKVAVNGHHIDGNKTNNKPDNIEFLTSYAHNVLETAPDFIGASDEDIDKYMDRINKLVNRETPSQNTIVYSGESGKLLCSSDYLVNNKDNWSKFRGEYKVIIK